MKSPFKHMAEATRLTQAGRLVEAMALLRADAAATTAAQVEEGPTRDADADVVDLHPPTRPGGAWSVADPAAPADGGSTPQGKPKAAKPRDSGRPTKPRVSIDSLVSRLRTPRESVVVVDGARYESRHHATADGARDYRVYVPSCYRGQPLPLLVMLHGCTQSADDFAIGTRMNDLAEKQGVLVAYPEQSRAANSSRCWNWFNAADQQRDRGEPALIAGITRAVMTEFTVDPARVFVAGLSAGGAMAATLATLYADLYAAVGVHSGLAHGAATDMPSAFSAMRQGSAGLASGSVVRRSVPTIVFHGDGDHTVHPSNAVHVLAQAAAGCSLRTTTADARSADGIGYRRSEHRDAMGDVQTEHWLLHGVGHAWSGGNASGSHTEPRGPDASREMLRFFLEHPMA